MTILSTSQLQLQRNDRILCHDLSITIQPGMVIGILGANGIGKTTLLHTLAGLIPPASGELYLNDHPLSSYSLKSLAKWRGILFQDFYSAMPLSVLEYCQSSRYPHQPLSTHLSNKDKQFIFQQLSIMNLNHAINRPLNTLSGGEKRRLAIAALLVQSPDYFFLDEPANHLDMKHQLQILNHFQACAFQGKTIIMTLHDPHLAQTYCTHLILIHPEGITMHGETTAMLTSQNLSAIYECNMIRHEANHQIWWQAKINGITYSNH